MGALDFYSLVPNAFGRTAQLYGQVFSSHAAIALKTTITETGLVAAVETRDTIGQAKGILMERHGLTAEAAFARLQQLSQDGNQQLRDLAEEVVRTGDIPR